MPALVIDSSVAASWCFPDERGDYAKSILHILSTPIQAIAPRLWAYEVRNSVPMGLRRKRIAYADAQEFFESIRALPIRLADPDSFDDVFDVAHRCGLTVYDAAYLDLALREGLPLATLDRALRQAADNSGVKLFQP